MAAATVNSSTTAYAQATDLTAARSWVQLADFLEDPATRSAAPAATQTKGAVEGHTLVAKALKWASGQVEAACTTGNRYTPEDLNALATGGTVGQELLTGLVCDLAFWYLAKRRKPGLKPDDVAGVSEALGLLDQLRDGERIFPFALTQEAGLPEVVASDVETNRDQAAEPLSVIASRLFGWRNR